MVRVRLYVIMARFIVAYDGSDPSRAAFLCALALAARTGGRWGLVVLHVIEPSPDVLLAESPAVALDPMMPPHMPMGLPTTLVEAERRQRSWIEQEAGGLRRECESRGVGFEAKVEVGSLLDVLEDTPRAGDIIAVGATGRFRRGGVGSTTKALVRNAACPVLVVHAAGGTPGEIVALACPFDGTPQAHDALDAAKRLAGETAMPLAVLAVARAGSAAGVEGGALLAGEAGAAAPGATVVTLAAAPGGGAESDLVAGYIRAHPGTLLVMGAYADSWMRELLLGSTTAQVLTALTGPVMLVHERDAAARR